MVSVHPPQKKDFEVLEEQSKFLKEFSVEQGQITHLPHTLVVVIMLWKGFGN